VTLDLLAIGAHPDDVELSCGGWLAAAAERGQRVGVVDLTRGELATNGTPEVRAREAAAAAEVLGLSVRDGLALPDGGLRADDAEQLAAVVGAIRRHRPALVVAPLPEDRHPDHVATGLLVQRAAFFSGLRNYRPDLGGAWRPGRLLTYPQRQETQPDLVVDVSAVYARKLAAVQCHASQLAGAATPLTQPLGLEAFTVRDRYWGATIGVRYGEPYRLGAPVPVADPVAHFAAHPAPPVLVPR
jgi:N-acetylglucosamine malate deacetylase 1